MSQTDREDAVARALDLLPPDDGAGSDPRLLRNPELVEEARATREAAADVWLATSPLRAAPSDVLHSIMARIEFQAPLADRSRGFFPWLAASGWAAAAIARSYASSSWPQRSPTVCATVSRSNAHCAWGSDCSTRSSQPASSPLSSPYQVS